MKIIESKCKICGGKALARFEDDAMPEAVDKFLPLLTCNRCYDLRSKRVGAEESIVSLCVAYHRSREKGKLISQVRSVLLDATRRYSEALQGIENSPEIIWSENFTDTLLEHPDQCGKILSSYRMEVKRSAIRANENHSTVD